MTRETRSVMACVGFLLLIGCTTGGCAKEAKETGPTPVAGSDQMPPEAIAAKQRADAMNRARADAQGKAMQQSQQAAPK